MTNDEPSTPRAVGAHEASDSSWRRLGRMGRPRTTRAMLLAFLLMAGLGFAIATQVRQTQVSGLSGLREDELVRILDTVQQDNDKLAEEIRDLEEAEERLNSGQASSEEARAAAEARLSDLRILAGTAVAKGPGVIITVGDTGGGVTAPVLLDALEELRDAGAEAIEISNQRIVVSSYLTDVDDGTIALSGKPLSKPYVIHAIGDSATLAAAMDIPGGISETVRSKGGTISTVAKELVEVDALQPLPRPRYAQPVTEPETASP